MALTITTRTEWGAKFDDGAGPAPVPAAEVWLHHGADTAPGPDATVVDEIAYMQRDEQVGEQRFGRGISYTFVVMASGRVYQGHSIDRRGTHTRGHNTQGRAIKWPGNFEHDKPTRAQRDATARLLVDGAAAGWWTTARLTGGHRDVPGAATACPGTHAHNEIPAVNRRAAELEHQEDTVPITDADLDRIARAVDQLQAERHQHTIEVLTSNLRGVRDHLAQLIRGRG